MRVDKDGKGWSIDTDYILFPEDPNEKGKQWKNTGQQPDHRLRVKATKKGDLKEVKYEK